MRVWRNRALLSVLALCLAGCSTLPYSGARFHTGYYEVRPGETLYSIAWRFDLNYRSLASWNGLASPYTIYPGQRLRMNPPFGVRRPPVVAHAAPPRRAVSGESRRPRPSVRAHAATQEARRGRVVPQPSSAARAVHWIWPTRGKISGKFTGGSGGNRGIDITGRLGQPVVAAAGGQVVYSGNGLPSYGKLLIIQHNGRYLTAYAHNAKLLVHEGEVVKQGQEIATMGRSGTNVLRPTLHFEIRLDGDPVDPLRYLPKQHG